MINAIGNFIGNSSSQGVTPASFENLEWWMDANNGPVTLDASTSMDAWADRSDNHLNGLVVTGFSHLRPAYEAIGILNKPDADFATSDIAYTSAWGAFFSKVNAFTLAGHFRVDAVAAATQGILTVSIASDDRFQISITGNTNLNFAYFNGTSWIGHQVTGITAGNYYFVFQQQPGVQDPVLWLNGTKRTTAGFAANGSVAANGIYTLGSVRETSTASQFDGKIAEMFLYSDFKSDEDVAVINTYLSARGGAVSPPRTPKIFALAGQSNAIGNNAGGAPAVHNGYQYTNASGRLRLSMDMSCAHAFANTYVAGQNSYVPVIVLRASSGVSVTTNTATNWSSSGTLRGLLETDLDAAVTHFNKSDVDGMIWLQGEADAGLIDAATITRAQFKTALQDVIDWWQLNYPAAPFYFVRTGMDTNAGDTQGFQDVRAVQQEIVDENENVFMAYTGTINFPGLSLMQDNVHYSQAGQNVVGEAVADFILSQ